MIPRFFLFIFIASSFCSAQNNLINPRYHLQKRLLAADLHLSVQLEMDSRVSKNLAYEDIPENALNAKVQVTHTNGKKVFSLLLETSRADIDWLEASPKGEYLLLVTENKTIDFGSYNGPVSVLYSLNRGRLIPVVARNTGMKTEAPMVFMRSLKENWRVGKTNLKSHPEIYSVSCRPVVDALGTDVSFETVYARYYFAGGRWHRKIRTLNEVWENDGPFPPRYLFP
jgi:hypothetical protein